MKVVLREDVSGVGHKGDVVDISDGFAQNKLIPQGMAFKATAGAERDAENMRKAREVKASEEKAEAEKALAIAAKEAKRLANRDRQRKRQSQKKKLE